MQCLKSHIFITFVILCGFFLLLFFSHSIHIQSSGGSTTFYDHMAGLSHQAFNSIAASIPDNISGRKVLAALIMKTGEADKGRVISLGTGKGPYPLYLSHPRMSLHPSFKVLGRLSDFLIAKMTSTCRRLCSQTISISLPMGFLCTDLLVRKSKVTTGQIDPKFPLVQNLVLWGFSKRG